MRASIRPLASSPSGSLLSRLAAPWAAGLWTLFLVWTAVLAVIWTWSIGEADVHTRVTNPELRAALTWLLRAADPIWVALAAVNSYLALSACEGLSVARRWTLIVAGGVFAVAALSVWAGVPLGPIRYTARFGAKLGPVPVALPLLWFVIVLGARTLLLRLLPRASHAGIAIGVGLLAGLSALNLEPVATRARVWWLWQTGLHGAAPVPTLQSVATWLIAGAALAFVLREERLARSAGPAAIRPALAFGLLHGLLLLSHLGRALGL